MKMNKMMMSVATAATLSAAALAVGNTKAEKVKAAENSLAILTIKSEAKAVQVFTAPNNGKPTGQVLAPGSAWRVHGDLVTVNGVQWANVGRDQWIKVQDTSWEATTKVVDYVPGYGIAVWNSPNANRHTTGQYLRHGTAWKASQSINVNGVEWSQVGTDAWVQTQYLKTPQATPAQPAPAHPAATPAPAAKSAVSQAQAGASRAMVATAYDPRVLGNTTFGYDTVAANLSVFPRGTRLKITFANGTSGVYVVRDTGTFAYSNPNQLDIAMPNADALQFGRQNITVQVLR